MSTLAAVGWALSVAAGLAAGLVYFGLLYRGVRMQLSNGSALSIIGLYVLRLALVGGVFWLLVQHGALNLLLGFGGFLIARFAARRVAGA
ncbi:MAG TPA: ATP synthase subunit I [Alphaproteobacteria bacterium]|nr:ATP synthase subunit I [Alphaproteobacteria bacterium]